MLNRVLLFMIGLLLAGCSVLPIATATQPAATATLTPVPSATATISPTVTPTLEPTATEVILPEPGVCSPLAGYTLTDLASLVVNSYHPPRLGSDDPHQGVDFGILDPVQGYALEGNPVQVALDETAPSFTPQLLLPTPLPQRLPRGALTCPELNIAPAAADAPRSLYILYGHMLNPPTAALGDSVGCGQEIGAIGQSGNALNPHVHVEVRVGPANQTFTSMAHYDPSAGYEEMAAYCLWRVSGVYQTIDPGCLWGACTTP